MGFPMNCLDSLKPLIFQAFGYPKTSHLLMFCLLWIQTLSSMFRLIPPTLTLTPKKGEAPAKIETLLSNLHRDQNARNASRQVSAMKVFRHLVWVEEIFSIAPHSGKTMSVWTWRYWNHHLPAVSFGQAKPARVSIPFGFKNTVWGHLGRRVRMMPAWHGGLSFARSHGNHFTSVIVPNPQYGGGGKKLPGYSISLFGNPSIYHSIYMVKLVDTHLSNYILSNHIHVSTYPGTISDLTCAVKSGKSMDFSWFLVGWKFHTNPKEERWQQLHLHHGLYQNSLLPQRLWPEYGKRRTFGMLGPKNRGGWKWMYPGIYYVCFKFTRYLENVIV